MRAFTLITGGSSGIGQAIAVRLSTQRNLIIHGTNPDKLKETLTLCSNREEHLLWRCDFKDSASIEPSLTALINSESLCIDTFVHSAGINKVEPIHRIRLSTMLEILNINFISAFEISKVLTRRVLNGDNLKGILFISSVSSIRGVKGNHAYGASKGALDSLMRSLAVELGPRIRVNCLLPGTVRSPMTSSDLSDEHVLELVKQKQVLGVGEPDDIADYVEFLLSNRARWITGQTVGIDGGRSLG